MKLIMKKIIGIFALGALFALTACDKDDIDIYAEDKAAVRFLASSLSQSENAMGGNSYSASDEAVFESYSFIENSFASSYEYSIPLALIGKTVDYDRQVSYVIEETSTAPEGSYEVTEAVIPAGEKYGYIKVNLKNTEELSTETYELWISLRGNDQLAEGPDEYVWAHLSWNSQIPEPPHNYLKRTYNMLVKGMSSFISTSLACYSPNALRAIVAATGWNDWDDYSVHGYKYNSASYKSYKYLPRYNMIYSDNSYKAYAAMLKDWLKQYEEEHGTPLLHDAGNLKGQPVEAREY